MCQAALLSVATAVAGARWDTPQLEHAETDRKVIAGRILLKWGSYFEKVDGQDRKVWAATLWPTLASADPENLQRALQAVTYEGMGNALLGQRPYDAQIIDRLARSKSEARNPVTKALGDLAADLVFTPVVPCRIVDTRSSGVRIAANATRELDASNPGGDFSSQGASATDCGIPANPAALSLSVTGLNNVATGYLRVFPYSGTSAQGSTRASQHLEYHDYQRHHRSGLPGLYPGIGSIRDYQPPLRDIREPILHGAAGNPAGMQEKVGALC